MRVLGIDPSLNNMGLACSECGPMTVRPGVVGPERLHRLWLGIELHIEHIDGVVLEGYGYMSEKGVVQGELGGVIRLELWRRGIPVVVVAPTKMKKFATGKGNADKAKVLLKAVRELGYLGDSEDEADALWLQTMGLGAAGDVLLAEDRQKIIDEIAWPELVL